MKVRVLVIALVLLLATTSIVGAKAVVGVLVTGFDGNSVLIRNGTDLKCKVGMKLYPGDVITALHPENLKIEWFPSASGSIQGYRLKVNYERPDTSSGLAGYLGTFMRHLDATPRPQGMQEWSDHRGADDAEMILPGLNATVIPGELINFAWGGAEGGQAVCVKDSRGAVVFRKDLSGQNWLDVLPEDIGMKQGETYSWTVEGITMADTYKIRLLDPSRVNMVASDLAAIGGSREIEKAAYLQMLSDTFSEDIDVYWLSYKYLKQYAKNNAKDDTFQRLWDRYQQHVKDNE